MNALSLFNGMSFGMMALETLGLPVTNYYSSEIDKHANRVTSNLFPDVIQLGDITKWREWDIDWASIDLIIGGSPCQGVSLIGQGLGLEDDRSSLFFTYMDIVNHCIDYNRKVEFFLENTKMKDNDMQVINEHMGIAPTMINSNLLSAQNRKRVYWSSWNSTGIEQPKKPLSEILLIDVLDNPRKIPSSLQYKTKSKCLRVGGRGSKMGDKHEWDSPYKVVGSLSKEQFDFYNSVRYSVKELMKLQTVPSKYFDGICNAGVSNTQLLKMLGNGWTHNVITHIFKSII
tara:strand:+ start:5022 stop:5882 length:861 start_codon:yes stop_codon:yes gene_type:complete